MIGRRAFLFAITLGVLATPLISEAQQAAKVPRIGYLRPGHGPISDARLVAFRQGLRELGYVEGTNILLEFRSADGKADRLPAWDIAEKLLELLKEVVPRATRIAFLVNPDNPSLRQSLPEVQSAARKLGVESLVIEAKSALDLDGAFTEVSRRRAEGVVIWSDAMLNGQSSTLGRLAAKHKLPTIGDNRALPENGGLASYGPNRLDMMRRSAILVDKILKGTKPADLPVEQPTRFELVINLKTAKALGLTIPPSVLGRADQVIK